MIMTTGIWAFRFKSWHVPRQLDDADAIADGTLCRPLIAIAGIYRNNAAKAFQHALAGE